MRKSFKMAAVLLCVLPNVAAARGEHGSQCLQALSGLSWHVVIDSSAALQQVILSMVPESASTDAF